MVAHGYVLVQHDRRPTPRSFLSLSFDTLHETSSDMCFFSCDCNVLMQHDYGDSSMIVGSSSCF